MNVQNTHSNPAHAQEPSWLAMFQEGSFTIEIEVVAKANFSAASASGSGSASAAGEPTPCKEADLKGSAAITAVQVKHVYGAASTGGSAGAPAVDNALHNKETLANEELKELKEYLDHLPGCDNVIYESLMKNEHVGDTYEEGLGEETLYGFFPDLSKQTVDQQIWFLRFFILSISWDCHESYDRVELRERCANFQKNFKGLMTVAANPSLLLDNPNKVEIPAETLAIINRIATTCYINSGVEFESLRAIPSIRKLSIFGVGLYEEVDLGLLPELTELTIHEGDPTTVFNLQNCRKLTKIILAGYLDIPLPRISSLYEHPIPLEIQVEKGNAEQILWLATVNPKITIKEV